MRRIGLVVLTFATACMTDPNGDSCVWAPGGDGFCPGDSGGGGDPPPSYHTFGPLGFVKAGGQVRLLVSSAGEDYAAHEELALVAEAPDALPERVPTRIGRGYAPALACATVCVAAWRDGTDGKVRSTVRDAAGWSAVITHEGASRAPAVATTGDLVLVAWSTWVTDVGARVELRVLDLTGNVTAAHTLARGVSHGHLSLSASPTGALVTWQRAEESTLAPGGGWESHVWIVAQPVGLDGAPAGPSFEYRISQVDGDYYQAAPAAFVDGAYRVTHGGLPERATWVVIDPDARTIEPATIGALEFPRQIRSIVPLAQGAVLGVAGKAELVRVVDDAIARVIPLPTDSYGAPAILPIAGGFEVAYDFEGSAYHDQRTDELDPVTEPTLLAERYELDTGCSAGRGTDLGALALVAGLLVRRRRRTTPRGRLGGACNATTCA